MFTLRDDLTSLLPSTDRVYSAADLHVKVRVLRRSIDDPNPEVQRACRAFIVSASLCDADGYALPTDNDPSGYLIAPAETLTIQLQGAFEEAVNANKSPNEVIEEMIESVRTKLLAQASAFNQALLMDDQYPTEVPPVN